jgi:hypothetical protein
MSKHFWKAIHRPNLATQLFPHQIVRRKSPQEPHCTVPFKRNKVFVGRESIPAQLLGMIPQALERTTAKGRPSKGSEGSGRSRSRSRPPSDEHLDGSAFWVAAVDALNTTFGVNSPTKLHSIIAEPWKILAILSVISCI